MLEWLSTHGASQVINSAASSIPANPLSIFSTTTVKPALGVTLTFTFDTELLLQDTGRVFGLADEGERERAGSAPGLRVLVEVLKSRSSVSCACFQLTRAAFRSLGSRRNRECS